jgi:Calcineurin-like phosphoesterase
MPVNPSLRHALALITLASLVYVLFYSRDIQNSQQHSSPLRDASDGRIARSTRIVAVGDLHGDIGNAQEVLEMARVVDSDGRWSGEVDIFVQTGDIIDRYVLRHRYIQR